ncbi:MAG: prepilin-type N-terminal cleavage/methylation domain-containing protein [Patescibacteria group bacterium]
MQNFYKKMNNNSQSGINLIEIIIVIAVIGIIVAVAVPQFLNIKKAQVLKNGAQDIFSTLNKARSQTLSSLDSSEYGVHFDSDEIVLFKGTSYSEESLDNENLEIISPATISTISLTGGADDVYFSRLSGSPSASGSITVSLTTDPDSTKIITILSTGAISVN